MNPAQVAERIFWTAVIAGLSGLIGVPLFGMEVWQAAGMAFLGAVLNGVSQFARYRLSVLPDPGQGLPGFEVSPQAGP